jgi:TRAP-type uncharacterized transport system fused permease subunit
VIVLGIDSAIRRRFMRIVWEAAVEAPKLIAPVTVACAVGGIIIGVINLTGLGERMSAIVVEFGGGYLILTLFLTMVLLVPALETMLIPHYGSVFGLAEADASHIAIVASHMFIIFCASKSSLTPPVAIASYAAAAVANSDPWKTSMTAFRIGLPIFIIPYMFVYGPRLLGYMGPVGIALASLTATAGVLILSVSCIGWLFIPLNLVERSATGIAALFLMFSGWRTDLAGFALFATVAGFAYWRAQRAVARGEVPQFVAGDMAETVKPIPQQDPPGS